MTGKELLITIAAERQRRCAMILAEPSKFRICEGCSSLLYNDDRGVCLFCHSYRFDHDPARILELAKTLGDKPMADSCPVLPRRTTPQGLSFA